MSEMIYIDPEFDGWTCPCGSNETTAGFYAATDDGTPYPDGATPEEWNGKTMVCSWCGRYFDQTDMVVKGINTNAIAR